MQSDTTVVSIAAIFSQKNSFNNNFTRTKIIALAVNRNYTFLYAQP